jgi:hypothetical protein
LLLLNLGENGYWNSTNRIISNYQMVSDGM